MRAKTERNWSSSSAAGAVGAVVARHEHGVLARISAPRGVDVSDGGGSLDIAGQAAQDSRTP